jgi:hypothetical protein
MSGPEQVYIKNDAFVYREIAGEAILVPIYGRVHDMASVYTFDEVGARIWSLLDGSRTVRGVCEALLEEFEATPEQVEADILDFVQSLVSLGALGPA